MTLDEFYKEIENDQEAEYIVKIKCNYTNPNLQSDIHNDLLYYDIRFDCYKWFSGIFDYDIEEVLDYVPLRKVFEKDKGG